MRVLICDDDSLKGQARQHQLRQAGFVADLEIGHLDSVDDAQALASQAPYAFILAPKGLLTRLFREAVPDIPSFDNTLDLATIYDAVTIAYGQGFQGAVVEAKLGNDVLHIDFSDRENCLKNGKPLKLGLKQYPLLCAFARQPGNALTRNYLEHQLWDRPEDMDKKNLSVQLYELRKKIGDAFIVTESGRFFFNTDNYRVLGIPQKGVHIGSDKRAYVNGMPAYTTSVQFKILECLLSSPACIWDKDSILSHLFLLDADKPKSKNYLPVQISRLNRNLAKASATAEHPDGYRFIENVLGQGYRLCAEPIPYVKKGSNPDQGRAPGEATAQSFEQHEIA